LLPTSPEATVAERFLLSLDLLQHGDPARELAYVALFDPYVTPCWNPVARLDDDAEG
jgi:hypothetical protein